MAKKSPNKMMKQVKKMQEEFQKAQEEIKKKEVEGSAGGGMVKIKMTGGNDLISVSIAPDAVDPDDVEMLEDLILAAFKNAQEEVNKLSEETFGGMTGGMDIPGLS